MEKEQEKQYIMLGISIVLAGISFYLVYKQEIVTAGLLVMLLLTKPILDIVALKQISKKNENLKIKKIFGAYKKLAYILYFLSALAFGLSLYRTTPLNVTIAVTAFVYAGIVANRTKVKYNTNIMLYNGKIYNLSSINKIELNETKFQILVTGFDKTVKSIKLGSLDDMKIVERILRRK